MTNYRIMLKAGLSVLGLLSLSLPMGCEKDSQTVTPVEKLSLVEDEVTLQNIFDEAAKGASANLVSLKEKYTKVVKSTTEGDALVKIKDSDGDSFLCKLLQLPAVEETQKVFTDLVTDKLTDPKEVINTPCGDLSHPIDSLIDTTRKVVGDNGEKLEEMLKTLVAQGDEHTLARANDQPKANKVLDAAKNKGDEALLTKVLKNLPIAVDSKLDWVGANAADAKVIAAFRAAGVPISYKMVVDAAEAAAVAPVNPPKVAKFKLLYDLGIKGDATGAKGVGLAAEVPTSGVADRLSHSLGKLPPDQEILDIWRDLFKQVSDNAPPGGGYVAIIKQVELPGIDKIPLGHVLVQPDSPARNQIIQLMVEQGIARLTAKVDAAGVPALLTAMRTEGSSQAGFVLAFNTIFGAGGGERVAALTWAAANVDQPIVKQTGTPTVYDSIKPRLLELIVDAAAAAAAAPLDVALLTNLTSLYNLIINNDASGAKGAALAGQAPSIPGTARFVHFISQLPPGGVGVIEMWRDFLTQVSTHANSVGGGTGGDAAIVAQAQLTGAPTTPLASMLGHPDSVERNQIIKLLVEKGISTLSPSVDAADVPALLTAMRKEALQVDFVAVFNAILGAGGPKFLRATTWAVENIAETITQQNLTPTVKESLEASITDVMIVDAAEVAATAVVTPLQVANVPTLVAHVKDLYTIKIKGDLIAGVKGAALAAQPPTSAVADRFSNFLAKLPVNADTVPIWIDYLKQIKVGGGPAVTTQVELLGAGISPFASLVNNTRAIAGEIPASRNNILSFITQSVNDATIAGLTDDNLRFLLNALLTGNAPSAMHKVLTHGRNLNIILNFAGLHRVDTIAAHSVLELMRMAQRIDITTLFRQLAKPVPNWKYVLFMVQVLADNEASALALATTPDPVGGIVVHNLIVAKAQTEESVKALKHYLSFLTTGTNWPDVRENNVALVGGRKAVEILKAGGHPDNAAFLNPGIHAVKDALLIFEDGSTPPLQQLNPPTAAAIANQAL